MTIKKEIEIDLPDGVAEQWAGREPVRVSWVPNDSYSLDRENCITGMRLQFAPAREPLVTRIARAVIAGECGFTPAMRLIEWSVNRWFARHREELCGRWCALICGRIPPHEPGDPDMVLVADINAEVERLRGEGGGV